MCLIGEIFPKTLCTVIVADILIQETKHFTPPGKVQYFLLLEAENDKSSQNLIMGITFIT